MQVLMLMPSHQQLTKLLFMVAGGICNAGMPVDTAYNQYLWTGVLAACLAFAC